MSAITIDFDSIRAGIDLRSMIEADLGPPLRGRRWACPFHGGERPNFGVSPDGRHWRCWTCDAKGDAIDYLAKREAISLGEAARRLGGIESGRPTAIQRPVVAPASAPHQSQAWEDPEWQCALDGMIRQAEAALWSRTGGPALEWLRERGLGRFHDPAVPARVHPRSISVGTARRSRPSGGGQVVPGSARRDDPVGPSGELVRGGRQPELQA